MGAFLEYRTKKIYVAADVSTRMKLFSIFGSNQLEPSWSFSVEGILWRILFSPHGRIVGECRNEEEKQASFFCLDEQSGSALWSNLRLESPWWVGMEAIHGKSLILHEFAKPDLPEHRGILAVDVDSGVVQWQHLELTFWFAYQGRIYAYESRFEKRIGHVLSIDSGEVLETYEEGLDPLFTLRQLAVAEAHDLDMLFPEIVDVEGMNPRILGIIKKETKGEDVVGSVEFIENRDVLAVNYHKAQKGSTHESPRLENRLAVFDSGKETKLYSDVLATEAKAPIPDSFFIKNESLYFVKNQQTLVSLRLWKS